MLDKIKDFLLNKALGRVLVRVSLAAAAYLASGSIGIKVNVDPNELNALLQMGLQSGLSLLKPRASAPKVEEAPKA